MTEADLREAIDKLDEAGRVLAPVVEDDEALSRLDTVREAVAWLEDAVGAGLLTLDNEVVGAVLARVEEGVLALYHHVRDVADLATLPSTDDDTGS